MAKASMSSWQKVDSTIGDNQVHSAMQKSPKTLIAHKGTKSILSSSRNILVMADGEDPRELTPEEVQAQDQLTEWKEKRPQQGKVSFLLKGSLTRAKRSYDDHYRLAQQTMEELVDKETKARITQASKNAKYEILHIKAKSRAQDAISRLVPIRRNLSQSITRTALETLKAQVANAEDEIKTTLWVEYQELM